jgi:hypothetical protein
MNDGVERKISIPDLMKQAKLHATQGDINVASALRDAASEVTALRIENHKLKSTIREIRSIANLSIMHRV